MVLERSLVAQMDASVMDYWGTYALADGGRHERLSEALYMQTAIPHCLFNSVILSGYDPATIETALDLAADCARTGGGPVLWRVGPLADNAELRARLEAAGLQPASTQPAMLVDLADLPLPPNIEGLVIAKATGSEERRAWGRLTIAAFEMEESLGVAMGTCEATIPEGLFQDQPRFTGYLDGEPVAVSSLVMTDGLAGVYAVATLPAGGEPAAHLSSLLCDCIETSVEVSSVRKPSVVSCNGCRNELTYARWIGLASGNGARRRVVAALGAPAADVVLEFRRSLPKVVQESGHTSKPAASEGLPECFCPIRNGA